MDNLENILDQIVEKLDLMDSKREVIISLTRKLNRLSGACFVIEKTITAENKAFDDCGRYRVGFATIVEK